MAPVDTPLLAVDAVILVDDEIVLIRRKNPPYKDAYALPGGFVEIGETTRDAARREAWEETGLEVEIEDLVGVYDDPQRDPRGHVVSIVYLARARGVPEGGSDASNAGLFDLDTLPGLAFDHQDIIHDAKRMIN